MSVQKSSFLAYFGLHYSKSPVSIREKFARAFSAPQAFSKLKYHLEESVGHAVELVPISTCNRFDICVLGSVEQKNLLAALNEFIGDGTYESENYRFAYDEDAFAMLCRIASSLDSLVLGESHILGQLKQAYNTAQFEKWCGSEAAAIFTRCFQIAKRVRSETSLGHRSVSVGHAAVDLARRVVADLENANVLVIGAGEMGRLTAQHFVSCGAKSLTIANRSFEKAQLLASEVGAEAMTLERAVSTIRDFDIVITVTSAGRDIIEFDNYKSGKQSRRGNVSVLVDISVPRNIDPRIGEIDDVFVFNVDDLDQVMNENRTARHAAALEAERIIVDELALFLNARRQKENLLQIGKFHDYVKQMVLAEIDKNTRGGAKNLDADVVANAIAKKLVTPVALMAKADVRVDGSIGSTIENIFQLTKKVKNDEH